VTGVGPVLASAGRAAGIGDSMSCPCLCTAPAHRRAIDERTHSKRARLASPRSARPGPTASLAYPPRPGPILPARPARPAQVLPGRQIRLGTPSSGNNFIANHKTSRLYI
jgi:hypothetical protein